ncbi:hypothetical protein Tco_0578492 [Tanacetum coccineum]
MTEVAPVAMILLNENEKVLQEDWFRKYNLMQKRLCGFDKTNVECYNCTIQVILLESVVKGYQDNKEKRRWNSGNKDGNSLLRPIEKSPKVWSVAPIIEDYPHRALKNKGIVDSGCSRHMTGNKAYLDEFQGTLLVGPCCFGDESTIESKLDIRSGNGKEFKNKGLLILWDKRDQEGI